MEGGAWTAGLGLIFRGTVVRPRLSGAAPLAGLGSPPPVGPDGVAQPGGASEALG